MKKAWILIALLAVCLLLPGKPAAAEETGAEDEWTVMFYFCGSDLESRYGYAMGNLEEILSVTYPDNFYAIEQERHGITPDEERERQPGKVNVLIETGGSREWHTEGRGIDIDPSALQRWSYDSYSMFETREDRVGGLSLMETLPLQSMADPETLSDFIRWGTENRPARKYALVLWGHGDGARTGLCVDELFGRDVLYLYELRQALRDGGVHFETVIIDACMMGNIETAWNIREYADWMVASEEIVPGEGTAVYEWLQQLFSYPEADGEWLGRCVCDSTAIKYSNEAEEQFRDILTWSVTDLTKADALAESLNGFFRAVNEALLSYPERAFLYVQALFNTVKYGEERQHMRDFGSLIYRMDIIPVAPLSVRNNALQALNDAAVYCVRGPGRSEARGLTFCYPAGFTDAELDVYSRNFPMPCYLAFIDAVTDWTAPDSVYEHTARLPDIDEIPEMRIELRKQLDADGIPGVVLSSDSLRNLDMVCYNLYRVNPETGATVRLGRTRCIGNYLPSSNYDQFWRAGDPMHWPSVNGKLMCMDLIEVQDNLRLYDVPIMLDSEVCILRMGRHTNSAEGKDRINDYEVYGLWDGYEENSSLLNRSVQPLSALAGREYRMLYPVDGNGSGSAGGYESSARLIMYRALDVAEIPLPAGTYYLEYEVNDLLLRRTKLERIEVRWDGENMVFPDADAWTDDSWTVLGDLRQNP